MFSSPPATFRAQYEALIASGAIDADPAQQGAAKAFSALEERLSGYKPIKKQGLLGRLFADKDEARRAYGTFLQLAPSDPAAPAVRSWLQQTR